MAGVKAAMRTLARGMVKLLCHILILPLFRVIEPFHHLRISHLWTSRFGPLGFNTHLFLGNLAIHGPERNTTRLFIAGMPANRTLLDLWRRRFTIIESRYLSAFMHYAGETLSETVYCRPLPTELVNYPAIDHGPVLRLNEDDHRRGGAVLESMGLGPADWWVCFQARDPLYHQVRGTGGDSGPHRNCRIENFMAAATEITGRGGFAIRTGATADRPLPATEDSRLVDYTQTHRSDFGDIYLYANCRFSLLAGTGSIHVPPMFKRPVALVNMMPLLPTPIGSQSLFQPKLFRDRASGRLLTFADLERLR
ncbi:MAG: TIGR04372 family glycosyltransferase, partial [Magnetospirillum sp.]